MENKKPTIVLIDDKDCAKLLNEAKVISDKFNIFHATEGREGVKLVFEHKPDIIISDVTMPNGDIFYVIKAVKGNPETKDIPIVAFTTLCSIDDQTAVRKEGVADYILKHECTPVKLSEKIEKILKEKNIIY